MAQNITLLGASYNDVPAVTLPKTGGGTARFDDASVTTATAEDVASGKIFLASDGTITEGTATGGGGETWDYEWDVSSGVLPIGMTATSYDFTTEAGALYVKNPNLDFNHIGDAEIVIKCKFYSNITNSYNPAIIMKHGAKAGAKFFGTGNPDNYLASTISGSNVNISGYTTNVYHTYSFKGISGNYTLSVDDVEVITGTGVSNSDYVQVTGIYTATGNYWMYIKSIKYRALDNISDSQALNIILGETI